MRSAPDPAPVELLNQAIQKLADDKRKGLLSVRRAIKSEMVKFNSCSTLYVDGLLANPDLKSILHRYVFEDIRDLRASVSYFLEYEIEKGMISESVQSEEIFSERLHPISVSM